MTPVALKLPQAAEAADVSLTTLKQWVRDGLLPVCRPNGEGGVALVLVDDLRDFLASTREGNTVAPLARHTARRPLRGQQP